MKKCVNRALVAVSASLLLCVMAGSPSDAATVVGEDLAVLPAHEDEVDARGNVEFTVSARDEIGAGPSVDGFVWFTVTTWDEA